MPVQELKKDPTLRAFYVHDTGIQDSIGPLKTQWGRCSSPLSVEKTLSDRV